MTGTRTSGDRKARSMARAKTTPSRNEPEMLTTKVPHGTVVGEAVHPALEEVA